MLLLGWYKYKKAVKIHHSKELVKDIQYPEVTLSQEKGSLKLEVKPYPDEISSHLVDDTYKNISAIIKVRDFYIIKLHNEESKVLYNDLKDNILSCIKHRNFINNKEAIELDILGVVRNNYHAAESLSCRIDSHNKSHLLYCNHSQNIWVISDNKKELEELKNELIKIFNDAIQRQKFELLLWYYSEIREYQTHINEKLKQLINEVNNEKVGVPLEGKCKKCLKEDTLLEYTWQYIKKFLP